MIVLEDRQALARDIHVAHAARSQLKPACAMARIELPTLQRWQASPGLVSGDRRLQAVRPPCGHVLTEVERAHLLSVANKPRFAARMVPMLADEGIYLTNESTFSRLLRTHGQMAHCGHTKTPKQQHPPSTYIALELRQVWCWEMTHRPDRVQGRWFHLYLIPDLYSRKIVGGEEHDSVHAETLFRIAKYRPEFPAKGFAELSDAGAWAVSFVQW